MFQMLCGLTLSKVLKIVNEQYSNETTFTFLSWLFLFIITLHYFRNFIYFRWSLITDEKVGVVLNRFATIGKTILLPESTSKLWYDKIIL